MWLQLLLRRSGFGLVALAWVPLVLMLAQASPVSAQEQARSDAPDAHARALIYRRVTQACQADFERLCPDSTLSGPRNEVICLKPYRADLSLGCRGAIDAARK